MKVGVISDIHGDYRALMLALERLHQHHRVDTIICAGDLVGRGPEPERVVQTIRAHGIPTVLGNHDEWHDGLSKESRLYLGQLPMEWRTEFDGVTVYMTHGKPGNNLWGLYPEHVSAELVNLMLSALGAEIMVTGHTHRPMVIHGQGRMIVNPGSLYTFPSVRPSSKSYGVLDCGRMQFEVFRLDGEPGAVLDTEWD
ncbi:MAG: hypothetical protein Kow0077_07070 [Anaerolineae bacterium]